MIYGIKFDYGQVPIFAKYDSGLELKSGEPVLVKIKNGKVLGYVRHRLDQSETQVKPTGTIIAQASPRDLKAYLEAESDARMAKSEIRDLVAKSSLDMKIESVAYSLDKGQLYVAYQSEKRIDFRQLLKDLISVFGCRIDLRQIGARDAARRYATLGPCGRPLCCNGFLYEFPTISIRMAKNQNLRLSQAKINGLCGRLMCCLDYEEDFYTSAREEFPDFGDQLVTVYGRGRVIGMNILGRTVKLRFDDFVRDVSLDELVLMEGSND